jgi:LPXTG-motif cell wall-anchored protein
MNKTLTAALATTAGLLAAGLVTLTAPAASATTPQTCPTGPSVLTTTVPTCPPVRKEPICATWQARGATGAYPNIVFGGQPDGTVIGDYTAKLTKPSTGTMPGVEFAARDLDLDLTDDTVVSVKFKLDDDASYAAGAIRMFGYREKDADTVNDAPDFQAVAEAKAGTLKFTVPAGKLGTLGLVYDASNDSAGAVSFSWLKVGHRKVKFTECPKPTPTATATATATPTATATATATPSSTTPSTPPSSTPPSDDVPPPPTNTGSGGGLPVTGPSIGVLAAVGALMLAVGGAILFFARRKKFAA